jgi:zinc protease
VVSGYLQSGSVFDPPEKLGLAQFTASMLMRGTAERSFQQIFDALESNGASLGFGASVHNVSFGAHALVEDLPLLLKLLQESLQQPVFPSEYVEKIRAQVLTGLAIRAQDTEEMASLKFDEIIFPDHPYGLPDEGYPETVQRIQQVDLVNFHRNHYGPRGMVIVVVGAVAADAVVEQIKDALGGWKNPEQEPFGPSHPICPLTATVRQHIPLAGKSQTDLVMGTLGPRRNAPDYLATALGNSVLGQFGMMGRIGDVVREQAGLAYHASTGLNAWIESGSWEISAGVNPTNLQRAIDLILVELKRFVDKGVTLEELQDSQANFIGRLPLSLESNGGVANALLNLERFTLGLDYYQRYSGLVEKITTDDVLQAARHYLNPEILAIVSSGPELQEK